MSKEVRSQILFFVGILLLVVIAGGFAMLTIQVSKNPQQSAMDTSTDNSNNVASKNPSVKFVSSKDYVKRGEQITIAIEFESLPNPVPNAISMQVVFDPNVLEISRVEPGNVWQKTNTIYNNIDTKEGLVSIDMGQGFNSHASGNVQIAQITAIAKKDSATAKTTLVIGDDSAIASVGENTLVKFTKQTYTVQIIDK
jgi:hypothetical protein